MKCELRKILKARGLSLVALARKCGVDSANLSRMQCGDQLGPKRRARIAHALRLPVAAIWPDVEVKP